MDYWLLMSGAALSLAGMVIHGYIGGRIYMANINMSDMQPLTKSLSLVALAFLHNFSFGRCSYSDLHRLPSRAQERSLPLGCRKSIGRCFIYCTRFWQTQNIVANARSLFDGWHSYTCLARDMLAVVL